MQGTYRAKSIAISCCSQSLTVPKQIRLRVSVFTAPRILRFKNLAHACWLIATSGMARLIVGRGALVAMGAESSSHTVRIIG